ncbi:hypothetical protein ACG904_18940 [Acinetobacter guillouiae]|uniref:hypothetical protein n=1 Tax=Acinetobacter guillouiae TaxID=106649 RepID=UPI003AF63A49
MGCAVDFVCRLLHLKIISLKNPLQIGLCNKAVTYQKATNGSRLTFTAGTLKPINNCIYLSNKKGDIPIVFPNTFQVKNNFVSNGDIKFQIGKEVKLIGHATSVENASSILKIPSNDCFKEKKMIWIFGQ